MKKYVKAEIKTYDISKVLSAINLGATFPLRLSSA